MCQYEAGPELDADVAEQVMDLEDVHVGVMSYWFSPTSCGYTAEPYRRDGMHKQSYDAPVYKNREPYGGNQLQCHNSGYEKVPAYSTDIAAAWEVVEQMRVNGWCVEVAWLTHGGYWFVRYDNGPDIHYHTAPTAPLAICLAALQTAEAGKEKDPCQEPN